MGTKHKHEVSTVMMQILVNIRLYLYKHKHVRSHHTISSEAKSIQYLGSNYISLSDRDKVSRVNYSADLYINVTYSICRLTRRVQQQCHTEDDSHRTLSNSAVRRIHLISNMRFLASCAY